MSWQKAGKEIAAWLNTTPAPAGQARVLRLLALFAAVRAGTTFPAPAVRWEGRDRVYRGCGPRMNRKAALTLLELRTLLRRYRFAAWVDKPLDRAWIIELTCQPPEYDVANACFEAAKQPSDAIVFNLVLMARDGALDRLRRFQRQQCRHWFYALRQDRKWCGLKCREAARRSTRKFKSKWSLYMQWYYYKFGPGVQSPKRAEMLRRLEAKRRRTAGAQTGATSKVWS